MFTTFMVFIEKQLTAGVDAALGAGVPKILSEASMASNIVK